MMKNAFGLRSSPQTDISGSAGAGAGGGGGGTGRRTFASGAAAAASVLGGSVTGSSIVELEDMQPHFLCIQDFALQLKEPTTTSYAEKYKHIMDNTKPGTDTRHALAQFCELHSFTHSMFFVIVTTLIFCAVLSLTPYPHTHIQMKFVVNYWL